MKKVLTIGGATQDIYLRYEGADCMAIHQKEGITNYMLFKSGEKIEVDNIFYFTGGGATNSAVSFKRLGFETSCFCKIGQDQAGKEILEDLKKEDVDCSKIISTKKHCTGTSFIINSLRKERTIFAYRGANSYLQNKEIPFDQIKKSSLIYITSLSNNSAELFSEIVKFAKQNNIEVAVNPGISQLAQGTLALQESLKFIDIFILNCSEAKTFMHALVQKNKNYEKAFESKIKKNFALQNQEEAPYLLENSLLYENFYFSIQKFFKEILKMGPKIVVLTNGSNGVYVGTKKEFYFHPAIKTEVIDTLGAGDAFGSCFVASLLNGENIQNSLQNGMLNSSSVINKIGAKPGLLTFLQLKNQREKLKKNLIQIF